MPRLNSDVLGLLRALKTHYRSARCELDHTNAFELTVATVLSAQCTDKRVNAVTPTLFSSYPTPHLMAEAPQRDIENMIRSCGFFRAKAKNIRSLAKLLVERFNGFVPSTMDELLMLPGVARKTANVVLGTAFNKADGVVVDTHVMRLSVRLGLSKQRTPEKIEKDLMKKIPREDWIWISHALIWHGRRVCFARNPQCAGCPVRQQCPNPVI